MLKSRAKWHALLHQLQQLSLEANYLVSVYITVDKGSICTDNGTQWSWQSYCSPCMVPLAIVSDLVGMWGGRNPNRFIARTRKPCRFGMYVRGQLATHAINSKGRNHCTFLDTDSTGQWVGHPQRRKAQPIRSIAFHQLASSANSLQIKSMVYITDKLCIAQIYSAHTDWTVMRIVLYLPWYLLTSSSCMAMTMHFPMNWLWCTISVEKVMALLLTKLIASHPFESWKRILLWLRNGLQHVEVNTCHNNCCWTSSFLLYFK